jgi:hypothetical protein
MVKLNDKKIGNVNVKKENNDLRRSMNNIYVKGGGDCNEMEVGEVKEDIRKRLKN